MVVIDYDHLAGGNSNFTFSDSPFFYDRSAANGSGEALFQDANNVRPHSNPKVSYYHPVGVGNYHYGERHPMKPARLTLTNRLVLAYGLHKHMDVYTPREATKEELEMFHDSDYVNFLST